MKTEVYIYNLNGNRAEVRDYAKTIASMDYRVCNAYVMAFDADDEILWTVQADSLDDINEVINWQGVRRVEIYDHSANGTYKVENVYVTSQKSLDRYTSERSADDYDVKSNTTPYTVDNWQKSDNSDTHNSNSDTPTDQTAEPSHLEQVAVSVKAYAANGAKRFAFLLSMLTVFVITLFVAFGPMVIVGTLFDALGITGAARTLLAMLILLWPLLELAINVECNAVVLVSRLFPDYLHNSMPFGCFSFWGRMCRA